MLFLKLILLNGAAFIVVNELNLLTSPAGACSNHCKSHGFCFGVPYQWNFNLCKINFCPDSEDLQERQLFYFGRY